MFPLQQTVSSGTCSLRKVTEHNHVPDDAGEDGTNDKDDVNHRKANEESVECFSKFFLTENHYADNVSY